MHKTSHNRSPNQRTPQTTKRQTTGYTKRTVCVIRGTTSNAAPCSPKHNWYFILMTKFRSSQKQMIFRKISPRYLNIYFYKPFITKDFSTHSRTFCQFFNGLYFPIIVFTELFTDQLNLCPCIKQGSSSYTMADASIFRCNEARL